MHLFPAVAKRLVQFHHPKTGSIDPEITGNGEHTDILCRRVNGHDNICLGKRSVKFHIIIAPKKQNINPSPSQSWAICRLVRTTIFTLNGNMCSRLIYNILDGIRKIDLIVSDTDTSKNKEHK